MGKSLKSDIVLGKKTFLMIHALNKDPKVLLVGQPTRGVDIGAIEFIHQLSVS